MFVRLFWQQRVIASWDHVFCRILGEPERVFVTYQQWCLDIESKLHIRLTTLPIYIVPIENFHQYDEHLLLSAKQS